MSYPAQAEGLVNRITKLKHTQNITEKDGRDYKICRSDQKKFPNYPHFCCWATTDPHPKGKLKGPPSSDGQGHGTKKEKINPPQEQELSQERTDLSPWKWRFPFAKLRKYRKIPK